MLSILIPVYNYNAFPLVKEIHQQCKATGIIFEILCQDDCSSLFIEENNTINTLTHCTFTPNVSNLGRGRNINTLVQKALFEWVLLLDCDTLPRDNFFIKNYLSFIQKNKTSVIFGGIIYENSTPHESQMLRWVYGKKREALPCDFRAKKPNVRALTSNLLLLKTIALRHPFAASIKEYGYEDLCFLSELERQTIIVSHLDNPIFHLNLETSAQFLTKTEIALKNLDVLISSKAINIKESKIASTFLVIKKLKLLKPTAWFFEKTKVITQRNLLSEKPSLVLFDWYKLGYLCFLQTNK